MNLYIPYVRLDIEKKFIANLFEYLDIGQVSHIDFVKVNKYGQQYHSAYVYVERWYTTTVSQNFQERVKEKSVHLVYDDPHYWVILENKKRIKHLELTELKNELNMQNKLYKLIVQEKALMDIKLQIIESLKNVAENDCLEITDQSRHWITDLKKKTHACDLMSEENCKLSQTNLDLMNELNYLKEVISQYEPNIRIQNKELYY